MSFPDYFRCKLPQSRFSIRIHFKRSLSEVLFICKLHQKNDVYRSIYAHKQIELFLKFWNTFHNLLGNISHLKQLVLVGNYLVENEFHYIALYICFGRYLTLINLVQRSTFSLDLSAIENIDHNNELFEFTIIAIFGFIQCSYLVLISPKNSISIQNLISSLCDILFNLKFISQIFIKYDKFFWLAFNSTLLIYSISLKLMSLRESHITLPFLHWSIILLESYSSTSIQHHAEMINLFSIAVCYVYDVCLMSREAEEFARNSLEKVQENYQQSLIENSYTVFKEISVQLLSVVFCYNVFNMRLKAKTVLKPKSRISLTDALHLCWPRSNTERLLSELMKQGVSSYFFAILYTLICTAHIKQNCVQNYIVYLKMDSEILFEIFNDIFQAGAFILMNTFNYIDYKYRETSLNKSECHMEDTSKFVLFSDSFSNDNQCQSLNYAFIFITLSFYFDQQEVFILIANKYLFVSEILQDNSQSLNRLTVKLLIIFSNFIKSLTLVKKNSFPDDTWIVYLKDISILMTHFTTLKLNQQTRRILVDVVLTIWSNICKYLSPINNYKKIVVLGGYSLRDFSNILDNLTNLIIAIHFIRIDPVIFQVIIIKNIILKENLSYNSNFQDPNAFESLLMCQKVLMKAIEQVSQLIVVYSESHSLTLSENFVENLFVEIVCVYIRISIRLTLLFKYQSYYVFANYRNVKLSSFLKTNFPTLIPLYKTLAFDKLFSYFFKIQLIAVLNENDSAHCTQNFISNLCGTLSPLGIENYDAFIHFPILKTMCDLLQTPPTIFCYTSNTICSPPILDLNIDNNGIDIYWWSLFANDVSETGHTETNPLTGFKRIGFLTPYKKSLILNMSLIQPGSYLFAVAYFDYHGEQIGCLSRSTKSIYIGFNVSYKIVFEKQFILVNPKSSNFVNSNYLELLWPRIVENHVDKHSFESIIYPIKEQNIYSYSTPLLNKIILAMLIKLALPYFDSGNSLIKISLRDNTSFPNSDFAIKLFSLHKLVLMLNDSSFIFKYFLLVYTTIIPFLQNFQYAKSLLSSLIIIFNTTLECFAPCKILCSNESYFKILISFSYSIIKKFDFIGEHNLAKFFFEFISQNVTQNFSDASILAHSNSHIPESFVSVQIVHRDLISRSKSRTSGHCLGNAVSSLKLKAKKHKNYIPTQMINEKFNSLIAFETFFFNMHSSFSSVDSLEITGNEDPFILNLLIATLQPTIAYKEVSKFRRRSKYIEYITKLCIKTYISGNLDLILTWSEEVFNWLQKRNEVLLTKVPLVYIQRDKIPNSSMDYMLSNNFFKDCTKDGYNLTNVQNINLPLNPLTEDKSFLKVGNKIFNTDKRVHYFKKVTNRLPRLQIRKDDVYSKARDILSTLVPSLWKSHCKRKRIRKITFAELPWRIELFNILSATRFELLLKCLKQNSLIKKDILFSSFTYSSPTRLSNIVNGKILFGSFWLSVKDINLSNLESTQDHFVDGTFPNFTLNKIISEFPKEISDETKQLLVNLLNEIDDHLHLIYYFLQKAIVLSDRSEKFLLGFNSCNILNNITQTLIGYFSTLNISPSYLYYLVLSEACLPYFFAACTLIKVIHNYGLKTSLVLNLNTIRSIIDNAIVALYYTKQWQKLINIIINFNKVCDSNEFIPLLIYANFQENDVSLIDVDYYLIKLSLKNSMLDSSSMYLYSRQIYEQYISGLNPPPLLHVNTPILECVKYKQEFSLDYFRKVSNVEIYPFSQISISKLVSIYQNTIFELRKNEELAHLSIACFELANLYFIDCKENLAFYYWSCSLDSFLGFQDTIGKWASNKHVFTDIVHFDKVLSKINILYAISICAIIGEKLLFSNLNLQIEYCLLAAHLHCLLFVSLIPDPFQFNLYVKFTLLEENVATFFPNLEISSKSSMVSIDISLLLDSLNWLTNTLVQSGHYWHTLPILILYEFVSVKIACSIMHTVLCILCKINVFVKLHFFKDAFFEFLFLFKGNLIFYKPLSNVSLKRYMMIEQSFSDLLALEHPLNSEFLFKFAKMDLPLSNDTYLYPLITNLIVLSKVKLFFEIISYYRFGINIVVSGHSNTFIEKHQLIAKFSLNLFENSESNCTFLKFIDTLIFKSKDLNIWDIRHSIFSIIEYLLDNILKQLRNGSIQLRLYFLIEIQVLYAQLNQLRNGIYFVIENFLIALNSLFIFNNHSEFDQIAGLFLVYHSPRYWLNLLYNFSFSLVMYLTDHNTFLPLLSHSLLNHLLSFAKEVFDFAIYTKLAILKAHTILTLHHPKSEAVDILHKCGNILDCTYPSIERFQNLISNLILLGDILQITSDRTNTYLQSFECILDFIYTFQECNKSHCLYNPNSNIFSLLLNRLGSSIFSLMRNGSLSSLFFKHSMISHNSSFFSSRFIFLHSNIHKLIIDLKYSNISCSFIDYVNLTDLLLNDICSTPLLQTGLVTIFHFLSQLIKSPLTELRTKAQLKEKCFVLIKAFISIEDTLHQILISPQKNCPNGVIVNHPMNFNFLANPLHCSEKIEFSHTTCEFLHKKSINLSKHATQILPIDLAVLLRLYRILLHYIFIKPSKLLAFGNLQKIQSIWTTQLISLHSYFIVNDLTAFGSPLTFDLSSIFSCLSYREKDYFSYYFLSPNKHHDRNIKSDHFLGNSNIRNLNNFHFREYECCFIWKLPLIDDVYVSMNVLESISCFYALFGKQCKSTQIGDPDIVIGNFSCRIDSIREIHQNLENLFYKCTVDIPPSKLKKTITTNLIQSLSCENSEDFRTFSLCFLRLLFPTISHPKFLDSNILSLELVKDLTDMSRTHCFQSSSIYFWIESNLLS